MIYVWARKRLSDRYVLVGAVALKSHARRIARGYEQKGYHTWSTTQQYDAALHS